MKVFIMRGLPGSGKTHYVNANMPDGGRVVSADHFYMKNVEENGVIVQKYVFDPLLAHDAHNQCLRNFLRHLNYRVPTIFVDNTNTKVWEISPYYRLAEVHGYDVEIIYCKCPLSMAMARGTHGVPEGTYLRMGVALADEALPPWWKQKLVNTETPLAG